MVKHGGSQLVQLKSALHSAGLSRTSDPKSKKRKRGLGDDAKDKKAAQLEQITTKLNPFERKVTRLKRDIPGQKVKGVTGRPGLSRQLGLEQRKKTLLVEYKQRGHAGGVVDRRFGENNPNMTPEERMLGRFTHERQKNAKVSFNLDDDEDLTHYGQSLNEVDDFEGTGFALENDAQEAEERHFGGFSDEEDEEDEEDGPPRKKTKAEVMAEVMEKSKAAKHERQVQKEQDDNLRHQLDEELGDIRQLLFSLPEVDLSASTTIAKEPPSAPTDKSEPTSKSLPPADTDYDRLVRELGFEKRAKPTDRMKTEEETALEEKEKLEKAERARLRRMNGEGDVDSDEEDTRERKKRKRVPQADDLEDDFVPDDDEEFLGAGLEGTAAAVVSEDDEDEDDEGSESSGSEGSEDDEDSSESEDDLGGDLSESDSDSSVSGDEEQLVDSKPATNGKAKGKAPVKELPFTFECPETHDDFLDIVADVADDDVATVVQRIRALYHPSLAVGNKAKLEVLTSILIEHILYAAASSPNPFPLITSLSPHIYSLTKTYAVTSAKTFIAKLIIVQKNLQRGLSQGPTSPESKTFPGIPELVLLRMIGAIWSTSDLWHPVVAPAMLLMGQYLGQCRVRSLRDLTSGLFLCTLFLQYQSLSKRLVPESINFLLNATLHLAPHPFTSATLPGSFPSPDFESDNLKTLKVDSKRLSSLNPQSPQLLQLLKKGQKSSAVEQSKVDLLSLVFTLIGRYAELYGSSEGFIDMFDPALAIVSKLDTSNFSPSLVKTHSSVVDSLTRRLKFARQRRQPLRLQEHKPIAISTIAPRFDPNFAGRKYTDDTPGAEAAKLMAQIKKEKKDAMRELRKDNKFIAAEKAQQQAKKDREYNERMARTVGAITSERAEQKKEERMKSVAKLRAGKKK